MRRCGLQWLSVTLIVVACASTGTATEPESFATVHQVAVVGEALPEGHSLTALGDEPLRLSPPPQHKPSGTTSDGWLTRVQGKQRQLGLLAIVVVGALVLQRCLGTQRQGNLPKDVIQVFGKVNLSGRQQLHLVRIGSRLLLLVESANGVQSVTEIDDPDEVRRLAERFQGRRSRGSAEVDKWLAAKAAAAGGR